MPLAADEDADDDSDGGANEGPNDGVGDVNDEKASADASYTREFFGPREVHGDGVFSLGYRHSSVALPDVAGSMERNVS